VPYNKLDAILAAHLRNVTDFTFIIMADGASFVNYLKMVQYEEYYFIAVYSTRKNVFQWTT